MSDRITDALLERFIAGDCTEDEAEIVEQWMAEDASHRSHVHQVARAWRHAGAPPEGLDQAAALRRFRTAIDRQAPARRIKRRAEAGIRARYIGIAATAAFAIGILATWHHVAGNLLPSSMNERVTRNGETARIVLGDGTTVLLGVASRLQYPAKATTSREVTLDGQAYFSIAPSRNAPFIVHAGGTTVRVLGTRFGIRAYPADRKVEVAVADGRIALSDHVILSAGDVATQTDKGLHVNHDGDVDARLAWTTGRLVFDAVPFSDAAAQLSRWYDLDISIPDSALGARLLTTTMQDEPASDALQFIALALNANYERDGRRVTFTMPH
jgi:ferric-dicitrate binding protein FerR (iron transport regulator)